MVANAQVTLAVLAASHSRLDLRSDRRRRSRSTSRDPALAPTRPGPPSSRRRSPSSSSHPGGAPRITLPSCGAPDDRRGRRRAEAARAAVLADTGTRGVQSGQDAVARAATNAGLKSDTSPSTGPAPPLRSGRAITARVTVRMPTLILPGIGQVAAWRWTASHTDTSIDTGASRDPAREGPERGSVTLWGSAYAS